MKVLFLILAAVVAASFISAAEEELPAPEVLTNQIKKITNTLASTNKDCATRQAGLEKEIATHEANITRIEEELKTVKVQIEFSQQQIVSEIETMTHVKELISNCTATNTKATPAQIQTAQSKISLLQTGRFSNILRDVVMSVQGDSKSDLTDILALIDTLIANLKKGLAVNPVETVQNTYTEQISVAKGSIEKLKDALAHLKEECSKRTNEFSDVLNVLKLVEQKFGGISIPNCQPQLDAKEKLYATCRAEKTTAEQKLQVAQDKLKASNKIIEKLTSDSEKCGVAKAALSEQIKTLQKIEADAIATRKEIKRLQTENSKLLSEKTTIEARLTETRSELAKSVEAAKCLSAKSEITKLTSEKKELLVKVTLGEKCALNYKQLTVEKSELIKQLEKLSVVSKQLEICQYDAAKSSRECSASALESSEAHAKAVHGYNAHIKELKAEIAILSEKAKCVSSIHSVETLKKEIITIKTQSTTTISQLETTVSGLKAELKRSTEQEKANLIKINQYFTNITTLEQKLKIVKADHENCVSTHTKSLAECKGISADLTKCQSDLKIEFTKINDAHKIKEKLDAEIEKMNVEISKLETDETHLKVEVTTLETTKEKEEKTVIELSSELKTHEANEKSLSEKKTDLTKKLSERNVKIETISKSISEITIKLKGEEAGNADLQKQLAKLEKELKIEEEQKTREEEELQKTHLELETLKDFKKAAVRKLMESNKIIEEAQRKIHDFNGRLVEITKAKEALKHKLSVCDASLATAEATIKTLHAELSALQKKYASLEVDLAEAQEAAKCTAHKATITELKKHGIVLRTEIKTLQSVKTELHSKVASLEAKLTSWEQLNHKLAEELKECNNGHAGCQASVRGLKEQMLSHLRKLKGHVTTIARLEEKLASTETELDHTRTQWKSDRAAYKAFKDNLLEQMAKLIALAKDAKHKFDLARAAAKNELQVQDAQYGACRKEVLTYQKLVGDGVVRAEREKAKAFAATKRYTEVRHAAEEKKLHEKSHQHETDAHLKEKAAAEAKRVLGEMNKSSESSYGKTIHHSEHTTETTVKTSEHTTVQHNTAVRSSESHSKKTVSSSVPHSVVKSVKSEKKVAVTKTSEKKAKKAEAKAAKKAEKAARALKKKAEAEKRLAEKKTRSEKHSAEKKKRHEEEKKRHAEKKHEEEKKRHSAEKKRHEEEEKKHSAEKKHEVEKKTESETKSSSVSVPHSSPTADVEEEDDSAVLGELESSMGMDHEDDDEDEDDDHEDDETEDIDESEEDEDEDEDDY